MSKLSLIATATFGLEAVVADELKNMGYQNLIVENGRVVFEGDETDIAKCNIWLRTADRVLLRMGEFHATSFEELFQGTLGIAWEDIIPINGKMHVTGKSVKSKLFSVPDCQAIVKKAVIEAMKRKYQTEWFKEDGPVYKIEVALLKDIVTLTIDTSGPGLHKRGYREEAGEAPLKETLAAALVLLSRWEPRRIMADPLCGSGTIPIEAALIGKNIAPGLYRNFVAETWPRIPAKIWQNIKEDAQGKIKEVDFNILGSDCDGRVLHTARRNAEKAGVSNYVSFQKLPVEEFSSKKKYGCIICNPPYGERIGEAAEVEQLYRKMGEVFIKMDTWSFFVLTAHSEFPRLFGKQESKNRKLYNGRIQCYYYQYFGPLPGRDGR